MFGFVAVFVLAVLFLLLTIFRQSKITPLYATISFVLWFVLGGINFLVYATTPSLLILGFLWFAVGVTTEILGLVIYFVNMKADKEKNEFTV